MVCLFFGSPPYFYFRFRLYGHRDGRFALFWPYSPAIGILDGTNGLSSSKPCVYCGIMRSRESRGNLCDITSFLLCSGIDLAGIPGTRPLEPSPA